MIARGRGAAEEHFHVGVWERGESGEIAQIHFINFIFTRSHGFVTSTMMRGLFLRILVLLIAPMFTGCFGYMYPRATYTPPVEVPEPEVKVFRVVKGAVCFGHIIAGAINPIVETCEIAANQNQVPAQTDLYWKYYFLLFPFQLQRNQTLELRFYRRGYETQIVESKLGIPTSDHQQLLSWKPAVTFEDRKKALDMAVERIEQELDNVNRKFFLGEYQHLLEEAVRTNPQFDTTRFDMQINMLKQDASVKNRPLLIICTRSHRYTWE